MKNKWLTIEEQSILLLIIISLIFSTIAYVMVFEYIIYDIRVKTHYYLSENDFCLYPNLEAVISGYSVEDKHFVPINEDPQLGFELGNEAINGVLIEFDEELERDTVIQLYYSEPGQGLQVDKVIIETIPEHTSEYYIEMVPDSYGLLRFDINGEFGLESIYLIKSEISKTEEVVMSPRENKAAFKWMYVVCFFFIFAMLVAAKETIQFWKRDCV